MTISGRAIPEEDATDARDALPAYNATSEITAPAAGQAFYGQDAQFAGNQPSYTKSADGLTVYDINTGLTWQDAPDTNGDGSITATDKLNWTSVQARPAALNAANYGGYSDWRLPTIKELYSLIDFRGTDPSGLAGSDTSGLTPFIDRNYFDFAYGDTSAGERIIDSQYASSTLYVGDTSMLFGVNFADGRIKGYGLAAPGGGDKTFLVQCVRGNTSYGINSFTGTGDGTVTDSATGLMWTQLDSGSGMNWENALAWVQTMNAQNYLGHNDWRLPNVKVLQSIVDYTRSPATTASAAIDAVFRSTQITNEAGQADYPFYWTATTHATYNGSATFGSYVAFGRGLGYMNNTWVDVHGAGCQRSDPKDGDPADYPTGHGPQGDAIRIFNYVRLVRDADAVTPTLTVNVTAAAVAENAGSAATTVTITRNTSTASALTVNLTSSDATEATVPSTATIPVGQSSVTVNLAAVDDAVVDGTQTVTITAAATGFVSGSDTVQVTDDDVANHAPTDVALAPNSVSENLPAGTVVGLLSSVDPDAQGTFAYALVPGPDSVDNAAFRISGNQLLTAISLDCELQPVQSIRVRTTDQGGLWFEKPLTITVRDVNESPRLVTPIPNQTAPANHLFRFSLAQDMFVDPDVGQSLSYAAALANGSSLPVWLAFDGRTRTFSGRPLVRDVGPYTLRVTSTDSGFPALAASTDFTIQVTSYPFPRQNADLPQDVDGSEAVSPLDALVLINWINVRGSGPVPDSSPDVADDPFSFVDVNGDNSISPSDVLIVINYINSMPSTALQNADGEGIPTLTQPRVATSSPMRNTEPLRLHNRFVDQAFGQAADLFSPTDWDDLLGILTRGCTSLCPGYPPR